MHGLRCTPSHAQAVADADDEDEDEEAEEAAAESVYSARMAAGADGCQEGAPPTGRPQA